MNKCTVCINENNCKGNLRKGSHEHCLSLNYYEKRAVKVLNKSDEKYNICKTRRLYKLPCKNCIYSDSCIRYKKSKERELNANAKKK